MDMDAFNTLFDSDEAFATVQNHQLYSGRVLGLTPGQRALVANGRIFGPLRSDEEFRAQDFTLVEKLLVAMSAGDVKAKVIKLLDV